jgi:hypothetical protein
VGLGAVAGVSRRSIPHLFVGGRSEGAGRAVGGV